MPFFLFSPLQRITFLLRSFLYSYMWTNISPALTSFRTFFCPQWHSSSTGSASFCRSVWPHQRPVDTEPFPASACPSSNGFSSSGWERVSVAALSRKESYRSGRVTSAAPYTASLSVPSFPLISPDTLTDSTGCGGCFWLWVSERDFVFIKVVLF